ncbi:MAG TPA: relaxase/mobilization nuclease domain-containing protein [Chryseolinea sp.]
MTGNQIKGRGFRGALRYNLAKVEKNMAEVLDHSFASVNEKSIMNEIQMVRVLRPNLQKFFYHTSINFPPHEDVSNDIMKRIALDYLYANGFNQHQFIIFRHYDAGHPHLHILVNRIDYDGKVLSDSNDFARSEKVLRELEKKYNLTNVLPSKQAIKRAATKDELEMIKRTGEMSRKLQLQIIVKDILDGKQSLTCSEFIRALEGKGISPQFNVANTGHVSGISYSYQGMVITGSKLGNDYKWTTLKQKIGYDKDRDNSNVLSANFRSKFDDYESTGDFAENTKARASDMPDLKESSISNKESSGQPIVSGASVDSNTLDRNTSGTSDPSATELMVRNMGIVFAPDLEHSQSPEASLRLTRKRKRRKGFRR